MKVYFIEFKESEICNKTKAYFDHNHNFSCLSDNELYQINDEDFIIWFIQNETYEGVINTCSNIRRHLVNKKKLFITAFENDKIIIGPSYSPKKTSGIDSALFFIYQEKYKILNSQLSKNIKLPLFKKVLNMNFYDNNFFLLMHKTEEEVFQFRKKIQNNNYHNCILAIPRFFNFSAFRRILKN